MPVPSGVRQRPRREALRQMFEAAIAAVDPRRLVAGSVTCRGGTVEIAAPARSVRIAAGSSVGVFGAGKASVAMAQGLEDACSGELDVRGSVIGPVAGGAPESSSVRVLPGDHPLPRRSSETSTALLLGEMESLDAEHYIWLISGGASSMFVAPIPPLSLKEKQEVTRLLLHAGASIGEINTARKHLSTVKGGRVLRRTRGRPVTTLILSDVVGDDPAIIGSGPTVPDTTTYRDAISVLEKYDLYSRCPDAVRDVLTRGTRGEIAETVRPSSAPGRLSTAFVVGSSAVAQAAAAAKAEHLGYAVVVRSTPLTGDTVPCARAWLAEIRGAGMPSRPTCFIAGGETTVRVVGDGKGGRNQEFALALVEDLRGLPISILSAGTDGIDGPTDAAGAFVDGESGRRAGEHGLDAARCLRKNDSFSFFNALGDLLRTGATGTNVMDLKIAVYRPRSAG